jgi:hypothetical protein
VICYPARGRTTRRVAKKPPIVRGVNRGTSERQSPVTVIHGSTRSTGSAAYGHAVVSDVDRRRRRRWRPRSAGRGRRGRWCESRRERPESGLRGARDPVGPVACWSTYGLPSESSRCRRPIRSSRPVACRRPCRSRQTARGRRDMSTTQEPGVRPPMKAYERSRLHRSAGTAATNDRSATTSVAARSSGNAHVDSDGDADTHLRRRSPRRRSPLAM